LSLFEFLSHRLFWIRFWATIFLYYPTTPKLQKKTTRQSKSQNNLFFPLGFDWWIFIFISFFLFGWRDFSMSIDIFFFTRKLRFPIRLVFFFFLQGFWQSTAYTEIIFLLFSSPSFRCSFFYFIILLCFDTFLITLLAVDESAVREAVWLKGIE
jgi:hypothetical protein